MVNNGLILAFQTANVPSLSSGGQKKYSITTCVTMNNYYSFVKGNKSFTHSCIVSIDIVDYNSSTITLESYNGTTTTSGNGLAWILYIGS